MPMSFTVAVESPEGDCHKRRFRVSLPRAPRWERARAGELLELLRARALAGDARSPHSSTHLATPRGPIGNHEPLHAHVCAGDELSLCDGEPPHGESASLWMWGFGHPLAKVAALGGVDVRAVALGSSHAAVLTGSGLILTWGANDFGQLGTGDEVPHSSPRLVRALARCMRAQLLACGPRYTAVVSAEGDLYTWGQYQPSNAPQRFYTSWLNSRARERERDELDAVGREPPPRERTNSWTRARPSVCGLSVCALACGTSHMAIADDAGELFVFGYNDDGQCGSQGAHRYSGLQKPCLPLSLPSLSAVPFAQRPLRLACGGAHTLVLTAEHELFALGSNVLGQLGLPERRSRIAPTRVPWRDPSPVVDIVAAGHASLLRLADGRAVLLGQLSAGPGVSALPRLPAAPGRADVQRAAEGGVADGDGAADGGGVGAGADGAGDGGHEPEHRPFARAAFELPSLPLPVGRDVCRAALSETHALLQAGADGALFGFGYDRHLQASVRPRPPAAGGGSGTTFVHPHQPARTDASSFEWERPFALAAGGGLSAMLTKDHRTLRDKCQLLLLSQLTPATAAPLLEAALRAHARALLRGCLSCIHEHGVAAVLAQSDAEYARLLPRTDWASLELAAEHAAGAAPRRVARVGSAGPVAEGDAAACMSLTRLEWLIVEARALLVLDGDVASPWPQPIPTYAGM